VLTRPGGELSEVRWLLWVIPVEWLIFFIMLRSTAKFLPEMFFPSEK
jgi:hypothetical protein